MLGKTISHYKILEKLGGGGMGVVYKARDTRLGRFVALKFLSQDLAEAEEDKKRFIQEAKTASTLDHPNICNIHEINETESGQLFIVMACYDGETLRQRIDRGPLSVQDALDTALQVAQGLEKAHENGIIHRDIKPANIIITKDGIVKILDFGLSKLAGRTKLTRTGATFGTVSYMSPEQACGDYVDARTDIWSLGVVLYEMITGRLPFQGEYDQAVIYSILNKTPEPVSRLVRNTPRQLDRIIFHTLEKNAADRLAHTKELQRSLRRARNMLGSENSSAGKIITNVRALLQPLSWAPLRRKLRKTKAALIISILAILSLIITFFISSRVRDLGHSDNIISVAVMSFDNNTGASELNWLSEGIPDIIVSNLSRSKYVQVIGLDRITRSLAKMGIEGINELDSKFSEEFVRRTGAEFIIDGRLLKSGSKFSIIASWSDMRPGGQVKSKRIERDGLVNLIGMIDRLSNQIKVALEIESVGTPAIAEEIAYVKTNSLEAYEYYIRGRENRRNMRDQEAILDLRKATEIDTSFAHAYDELAAVYNVLGETSLAHETIKKAIRSAKKLSDEEQLRFMLNEARLTHDYESAVRHLRQLILLQPNNPDWHFQLGWNYITHRRSCESGILEYKKAIALDPNPQPNFYYYLGYALLECGFPEEAISKLERYVSLLPEQAVSHDQLGRAYAVTGEYGQARKNFELALELDPRFTPTLLSLGMFYSSQGRNREAISFYKEYFLKTLGQKQQERGYFALAKLYFENSKLDTALTEIKNALACNPNWVKSYWLLGLIQLQKGNLDSAKSVHGKMQDILADLGSKYEIEYVHHLNGKIHEAAGQFDEAIIEFQQAIKLGNPELAYFRNDLAEVYCRKGELERAIEAYEDVFNFNPLYPYSFYGLGQVYEKKNDFRKAIQAYKTSLKVLKDADEEMLLLKNVRGRLLKLEGTL